MTSLRRQALAAASGVVIDRVLGEPPAEAHPVAMFGRAMQALEDRLYRDRVWAGAVHAVAGLALGVAGGGLVASTTIATAIAMAGRGLAEAARAVGGALRGGDLDRARALLPSLVGRDPADLDAAEIARATVESVAENTVDAVVGPGLWAAVGGAPGALGYRAVNTMDAMVGHRSDRYRRYGRASARLDDLAGWVPARATAALVTAVRPDRTIAVWRAVRAQAPAHPSPNAGVAEAAFAAALDLGLGGANRYGDRVEHRPILGTGPPAGSDDIERAVRLSLDVGAGLAAALAAAALVAPRRLGGRR
ncbi:MAG: adenosylcobinamide-phosphate synthase CbiB [Actinobacteria bacterium]|nr:adenosylcobinamide-phosphate synthase CbiB [Actinomycetota bacterium]